MSNNIDKYVEASQPEPVRLLGLTALPFCLGHYANMIKHGCAWANETPVSFAELPDMGVPDLLLGILICAHTYEGFQEFITDEKEYHRFMKQWGKAIHKISKLKGFTLVDTFAVFSKYMKDGMQPPYFFPGENSNTGRASGASWLQRVKLAARSELNYSETEVYNAPLSRIYYDYFGVGERNGMVEFLSDRELQLVNKE